MSKIEDINLICRLDKNWSPKNIKVKKAGGQTNRNYIVQHKDKKFFVRLPWERTDIIDRKMEAKNVLAIAKCRKLIGVVPKCYFYAFGGKNVFNLKERLNVPDGAMIIEYIEGKDINGNDLARERTQNALVRALYAFHSSGVKFTNTYDVFRDEVGKYKKEAKKYPLNQLLSEEKTKEIEEIEQKIKKNFPLGGKISTHNDLIFSNLRLSENSKIYILDFEYGGLNIRSGLYYDLGIILGGNIFQKNPINIEIFQEILKKAEKIYKRKLNRKKIYLGALINILVMFWWGLVKYFSSTTEKEKVYFKSYVQKRIEGINFLRGII